MTNADPTPFGELLRRHRMSIGLTQEMLAERAGVSARGVSDLERGVSRAPRVDTIQRLADALTLAADERAGFIACAIESRTGPTPLRSAPYHPSPITASDGRPVGSGFEEVPALSRRVADARLRTLRTRAARTLQTHLLKSRRVRNGRHAGSVLLASTAAVILLTILSTALSIPSRLWPIARGETRPTTSIETPVAIWGGTQRFASLRSPSGLAVDRHRNVYVADAATSRITVFSSSGRAIDQWGISGSKPGQLRKPQGLAIDMQGQLYVADTGNHRIEKFSPRGRLLYIWKQPRATRGRPFTPTAVAVRADGLIVVSDAGDDHVKTLSPAGSLLATCCHDSSFQPSGVAVDAYGTIYVADQCNEVVQQIEPDGKYLMASTGQPGQMTQPTGVATDAENNLFVADAARMQKFSPTGELLSVWHLGEPHRDVTNPVAVAVDRQGDIYLSDAARSRVLKLSPGGKIVASWGRLDNSPGSMRAPRAIAVGAAGTVYVADTGNNRIDELTHGGKVVVASTANHPLLSPMSIAIGPSGYLYVASAYSSYIDIFTRSGSTGMRWKTSFGSPFHLDNPTGVTVDAHGNVYVVERLRDRLQEFSPSGVPLADIELSPPTSDPTVSHTADGVAVTLDGNAYITDAAGNQVEELSSGGRLLRRWGHWGPAPGELFGPEGATVDQHGRVYVADTVNDRIDVYSSDGRFLHVWGGRGSRPGRFVRPEGVAVDGRGDLFVADTGNDRVQEFSAWAL